MWIFSQGSPNSVFTQMPRKVSLPEKHCLSHPRKSLSPIPRFEEKPSVPLSNTADVLPEALNRNRCGLDHLKVFLRSELSLKECKNNLKRKKKVGAFSFADWIGVFKHSREKQTNNNNNDSNINTCVLLFRHSVCSWQFLLVFAYHGRAGSGIRTEI